MTRKVMLRLMAIILVTFLVVVACDSKDSDTTSDPEPGLDNVESTDDESEEPEGLPPMTDDEITLTFGTWLTHEMNVFLADKFMEKYSNITVEVVQATDDLGWNDFLTNLASNGELPDVYWYNGNLDVAIQNSWLGDFTDLFESDPENERLLDTLYDVGYFDN